MSPREPVIRPRTVAPWDSAQSSITASPCRDAISRESVHVHRMPEEMDRDDGARRAA